MGKGFWKEVAEAGNRVEEEWGAEEEVDDHDTDSGNGRQGLGCVFWEEAGGERGVERREGEVIGFFLVGGGCDLEDELSIAMIEGKTGRMHTLTLSFDLSYAADFTGVFMLIKTFPNFRNSLSSAILNVSIPLLNP